ncbi:hypothetical protein jhhlp_003837 [Lomentospora prolificans]|uniref:Uncharacterized protein n=1 Tax=Lomentospora prolificans TaxID=41688 RepID=A0A2N3N9W0_9PEZI|nr:hypothetical protein jhhlp_003837 [Lomentospora prolificans]
MVDYMKKKGFDRPLDVWFEGLEAIIQLDMNKPSCEWREALVSAMFMQDAMWFWMSIEMFFMALCTVANNGDEYILVDNSYNIFEGPSDFVTDPKTGKVEGFSWRQFHEFAPLSPKLIVVLRSNDLPYRGAVIDPKT